MLKNGFYNVCVSATSNTFKNWFHSYVCMFDVTVFVMGGQVVNFMPSIPGVGIYFASKVFVVFISS